jgi:hypothetical protein
MLLIIALIVAIGLGSAGRATRGYGLIDRHAYNNRYSDATGSRSDHLG